MARIGFIGLGNMGGPMARNLLKAGHQVTGFDLVPDLIAQLVKDGAVAASSPADAARDGRGRRHHAAGGRAYAGGLSGRGPCAENGWPRARC